MPLLTLHVLPPAFSLPSIPPDCITAIAYLRYTQRYGTWVAVADAAEHPHLVAPFLIPAYHHPESQSTPLEGLDAIIHYLSTTTNGSSQLNDSLTKPQAGEAFALSSHLQARLRPLIALSLFASPENYASATRKSFASTLPFPESWMLPHKLHNLETASCAHLGIEPKDLDLLIDDQPARQTNGLADAGPFVADDIADKQSSDKKSDPSIAIKIKLRSRIDKLVYDALAPFVSALSMPTRKETSIRSAPEDTLPAKSNVSKARWLFSASHPAVADFTALSLLSLALLPYSNSSTASTTNEPILKNPFLPSSINRQFPNLISDYLLPGLQDAFGGKISPEKALKFVARVDSGESIDRDNGQNDIPWKQNRSSNGWQSMQRIGNAFGAVLTDAAGLR